MEPLVTIVTASYNKAQYLLEASKSVFNQQFQEFSWWIILNGADEKTRQVAYALRGLDGRVSVFDLAVSDEQRKAVYFPAVCMNQFYPMVSTKYLMWFSDDDLLYPEGLKSLVAYLEAAPDKNVAYGNCSRTSLKDGEWKEHSFNKAETVFDSTISPHCCIDGGQILQTKYSHKCLGNYQLPIDWESASHVDGIYMERLSKQFKFWPVNVNMVQHRCTPLSTHGG
jgi:hypothetical protein